MKITGALLCAGCIVALLAIFACGTASAAVVPFNGVEYSWLHHNDQGEPVADWIKRINDIVAVRNGDMLEFQNRWYNSYAGTADIKISYGGERAGICYGADPYVSYGLNYGNYYPSSKESVPYYSQVLACNQTPRTLLVSHQYVYNGIQYGTINPDNDYTMLFQWRYGTDEAPPVDEVTPTPRPTETVTATPTSAASATPTPAATPTPTATARPSATPTLVPLPKPSASPGFGFEQIIVLVSLIAVAYAGYRVTGKK
jgi:cell division septation protein DedD